MTRFHDPRTPTRADAPVCANLSRRGLLTGGLGLAGAFSLSGLLAACGSTAETTSVGAASGAVNVLGWTDYNAPELNVDGISANWTPLTMSSDLYTKTQQAGTFDIGMPTSFLFGTMLDLDLVEPLDEDRLPNLKNIDPGLDMSWARAQDGKLYAVPLLTYWSYAIWDKAVTSQPQTFEDLMKPELKGKVGLLDDQITMNILAALTGDYDGGPFTEEKLDEVLDMLERLRPQVGSVYPFGGSVNLFSRKEISVTIHSNLPEIRHVREAGVDAGAGFFGTYIGVDGLCMIKGAKNPDAVYDYLDHSLTAEVQAAVTAESGTAVTVKGAEDMASDVVTEFGGVSNILENGLILSPIPAESSDGVVGFSEMSQVWQEFKESL